MSTPLSPPITRFTIDFPTWLQGEGADESYLFRADDCKQCCLGFYLAACHVPQAHLTYLQTPALVAEEYGLPDEAEWLILEDTDSPSEEARALMGDNDESYAEYLQRQEAYAVACGEQEEPLDYVTWIFRKMSAISGQFARQGIEVRWDNVA